MTSTFPPARPLNVNPTRKVAVIAATVHLSRSQDAQRLYAQQTALVTSAVQTLLDLGQRNPLTTATTPRL